MGGHNVLVNNVLGDNIHMGGHNVLVNNVLGGHCSLVNIVRGTLFTRE